MKKTVTLIIFIVLAVTLFSCQKENIQPTDTWKEGGLQSNDDWQKPA